MPTSTLDGEKKGARTSCLPPRLGVLPHPALGEEEQRWEAEQELTKDVLGST